MNDSSIGNRDFIWNSYLFEASLDTLFSAQLTHFLLEFEKEWATHFSNASYQLCQLESGNRLRPIISFLGYLISETDDYLDSADFNRIIKAGICIELIHKSSLIIDDIVDGDTYRGGKLTFHVANGQDKAIAVATYLISKSLKLLTELLPADYVSAKTSLKCIEISINILNDLSTGLLMELSMEEIDLSNIKKAEEIIKYEAASIIKNSLLIGYTLRGGSNPNIVKCLEEMGDSCGYIFQVMNDIEPYKRNAEYTNHKANMSLEIFHNRKNIITTFILQLINSKERTVFHSIKNQTDAELKLFEYFGRYRVFEHFMLEIQEIKLNIKRMIQIIRKERINVRWCENCESFINSLTKVAISRIS